MVTSSQTGCRCSQRMLRPPPEREGLCHCPAGWNAPITGRLRATARLENSVGPAIVWERAAQRLCGLCAIYRFSSQWIRIAGLIIARTGSTSEHAVACALAPVMMGLVHELWSVIPPQATSGVESGTCSSRTSSPSSCRTLLPAHHPPGSRAGFPGSAIHAS
jgi:hypothetical protein